MVLVAKKKRPTTIHHKRRHGQHHARDERYHKAYWPYLPMALIVGLGMVVNTFWGTIQHNVLSYATNTSISGLLQATNEERAAGSLGSLALNAKLNQAAQAKANDMAARNYWSHDTPEGNPPWIFFTNAGYQYQSAGENLAYGFDSSTETITGWMNSPGHKANVMSTNYKEVGFGIANAEDYQGTGPETIVVAMYGSPKVAAAAAAPTAQPQPKPAPKPAPAPAAEPAPAPAPVAEPAPAPPETNATPVVAKEEGEAKPLAAVEAQNVTRVQLLSGGTAPWSMFAVSAIATFSIAIFFLKHGLLWRRVLLKSEAFVHKHPFLDIALVSLATIGFVLTRTDGIIR